jgi:DNA-binding SARP family transcriptional activator
MLEVRLIGKFDIRCDGKPVAISSRAAQSLFAYLVLTVGTLHRREKLAGLFWPDLTEEKARADLRTSSGGFAKHFLPVNSSFQWLSKRSLQTTG